MKRVTLILVMLLCANAASGQTVWLEDGDAPALLPAQATIGPAALTEIKGSLGNNTDVDLYVIYIDDEAVFSATTIGGASFDTALYLFDPDGYGIAMSDDAGGGSQSTISSTFVTANGTYILAVTGADRDPVDWVDAEVWLDTPKDTERAPDGAGAAGYLDDWIDSGAFGAYRVFLTGARCATVAACPPAPAAPQWTAVARISRAESAWLCRTRPTTVTARSVRLESAPSLVPVASPVESVNTSC